MLSTGLNCGGAETQLLRIACGLVTRGWRVHVISMMDPPADARARCTAGGIELHSLAMRRGWPSASSLWACVRHLRRIRPQAIVCFMLHANVLGRVAGRLAGVPCIIASIRNSHFGGRWGDFLERITEPLGSITTANSSLAAEAVMRRRVVRRGRLLVVGNALDPDQAVPDSETREATRRMLRAGRADFVWLAVGRLERLKDYPTLIAAIASVARQNPGVVLAIAGMGPLRLELEALVAASGLTPRVQFLGLRSDVRALLAASDGFVLSSLWEGLPNAVMEALAAGVPVVATTAGGVEELVEDGRTGLLVAPGDPAALADAMLRLMAMPAEKRRALAAGGRSQILARYACDSILSQWEDLIRGVVHGARLGSRSTA